MLLARTTRAAAHEARLEEAIATGPLGALSHDELGVIFDGLADPLQPIVAVALSSTCLGLRTPFKAALEVLKDHYKRVLALCKTMKMTCADLHIAEHLHPPEPLSLTSQLVLDIDDVTTLGMLVAKWLPRLRSMRRIIIGDEGLKALCKQLSGRSAPALTALSLAGNQIGKAGAEAFADALRNGVFPVLEKLDLSENLMDEQIFAALAAPLRKLPKLKKLYFVVSNIGDRGAVSLLDGLGEGDFQTLETIEFGPCDITDTSLTILARAINEGGLPHIRRVHLNGNSVGSTAHSAVQDAVDKAYSTRLRKEAERVAILEKAEREAAANLERARAAARAAAAAIEVGNQVGDVVQLDLRTEQWKPLNGQYGRLEEFEPDTKRWQVLLYHADDGLPPECLGGGNVIVAASSVLRHVCGRSARKMKRWPWPQEQQGASAAPPVVS